MNKVLFSIFKDNQRSKHCIWKDSFLFPDIRLFNRLAFRFPRSSNAVATKMLRYRK